MPRDANGVFTPLSDSWNPAVDGTIIDSSDWAASLADMASALNDFIPPPGTGGLFGRDVNGAWVLYTAGEGISIDATTHVISVANALTDDEPEIPTIGTGGTYTVAAADRDISPDGTSLQLRINRVRNTTLSNPVTITFPASSTITGVGTRFIFEVASDQTGAVSFVPAAGGTVNGGSSVTARGPSSLITAIVDSNPGSAPVIKIYGDTTEDKTVAGNVTFTGDVTFDGSATANDEDIPQTASFIFAIGQDQRVTPCTHATVAIVGTIPPVVDVSWREGALLTIIQRGAAAASFAAGAGVTIHKLSGKTTVAVGQYGVIFARHTSTPNTWECFGDLGT